MKQLLLVTLILLASCDKPPTGGKIVGKLTRVYQGVVEDRIYFIIEVERDGCKGTVEVSEKAWNQASKGMEWPFEVK